MAYDIGPKIGIEGEAQFRAELKNISQNIKTLGSEMGVVTSAFAGNEKSMESLTAKQAMLREQIEATQKKVDMQRQAVEKSAEAFGVDANETLQWRQALAKGQTELNNLKAQLSATEKAMDDFGDETDDAEESLDKAGEAGLSFGDVLKANVISDAILSGVKALGSAIDDVSKKLIDFAKTGIDTASDLDEVQNVVDVTFGSVDNTVSLATRHMADGFEAVTLGAEEMTDGVAVIEEFARSAATSFGMSELSAKQYAGTMGAMLKSMGLNSDEVLDMSTDLVGLAGDLASFYNLDVDEAFAKIRSGISGETEPLKQLGINMSVANLEAYAMSQGIETAYKEMTQAEQATLRYNYLLNATKDAQGDFARTSDSYANQQKIMELSMENLSAAIGTKLLPYMTSLTGALNGLLSGEMDVTGFVEQISVFFVDAATALVEQGLPALQEAGASILTGLIEAFPDFIPSLTGAVETLGSSVLETILALAPSLLELAGELIGMLVYTLLDSLPDLLEVGMEMLTALVNGIATSLPELIPTIVATAMALVERFTEPDILSALLDAALLLIVSLAEGLVKAIPELVRAVPNIIENMYETLMDSLPKLLAAGAQLLITLAVGIVEAIPELVAHIPAVITAMVSGIKNGIGRIKDVGKNIISGLWEGITSMITWLNEKIDSAIGGVVGRIKNFLGIHSPSRVFAGIGGYMAEGLGLGFDDAMERVSGQIQRAIPTPTMEIRSAISGAAASVQDALTRAQAAGTSPTHFDLRIDLDGQTLARRTYTYNQREATLRGGSLIGGLT